MEDYKNNSHKAKEKLPEKKVEAVAKGRTKKKSEISKLKEVFISEDASNVKSYVVMDVLVPAVKKAVSDIITNGIEMILYGTTGDIRKRSRGDNVSYRNYYDSRNDRRSAPRRSSYSYDDVAFDTRGEAEMVLTKMDEILDRYGFVTVADLYDMAEITCEYTDYSYGWRGLNGAEVVRARDGSYFLKLPRAIPIE